MPISKFVPEGPVLAVGFSVRMRVYIAGGVFTLLFCAIAYRAYGLQIEQREKYHKLAQRQHLRMVELPAPRGPILDIKGRELAVTAAAESVFANPREVDDAVATADALADAVGFDRSSLTGKLSTRRHFVWLKRQMSDTQARAIRDLGLEGIYLTPEPRRYYPGKSLAGPVLGFAGIDGNGLEGLEYQLDDLLLGQKARFSAVRDASGRMMMADGVAQAQAGATVVLTLDRAVQYIAEQALAAAVADNQAKAGSLVVIDVATGGVLALASVPTFDPNTPAQAGRLRARNRAVTDAFEIGSIMKVFTLAGALDAGVVDTEELIDVEHGRLKIGRKLISDTYRDDELTVAGIIKRSSNVGAVKIARRLGKEGLHDTLKRFGFATSTGIELPGERAGRIINHQRLSNIGLATMSFGYGVTVTPLQIAAGIAAIGADGEYREPRIVHEVRDADGEIVYRHQPQRRQVIDPATARALLPMLASVFDKGRKGGTARSLTLPPFSVGGKTGTARKVDPATMQYSQELYVSSFAGLAPIEHPRIAVAVVIDEPQGEEYYGGEVAGPAFVQVVDETLRYLGVSPRASEMSAGGQGRAADDFDHGEPRRVAGIVEIGDGEDTSGSNGHSGDEVETGADGAIDGEAGVSDDRRGVRIPNFIGMSMGRALDAARAAGVGVSIEGSGRAVEQYPPPGWAAVPAECSVIFAPRYGDDASI